VVGDPPGGQGDEAAAGGGGGPADEGEQGGAGQASEQFAVDHGVSRGGGPCGAAGSLPPFLGSGWFPAICPYKGWAAGRV
jgi:hypothetical protein